VEISSTRVSRSRSVKDRVLGLGKVWFEKPLF
jgi:hypothetical protein